VIDDEPHIWRLLDPKLAAGGFAVRTATSSEGSPISAASIPSSLPSGVVDLT